MGTQLETVEAMKAGHAAMAAQMKDFDIDKFAEQQDEMQDMMMDLQEMNDMMARTYAVPGGSDESELEGEFAALEEEMKMEEFDMMMAGGTPAMAQNLPSTTPAA